MSPEYQIESDYLKDALEFLKTYHWIYSSPNTHILTNKVFDLFPNDWLPFLSGLSEHDLNQLLVGEFLEGAPGPLNAFLQKLSLLRRKPLKSHSILNFKFQNNCCLGLKKQHEIKSLAPVIHDMYSDTCCDLIVDVGTGLGYLPRLLSDQYQLDIIGVEGNPEKIRLAQQFQTTCHEGSVKYFEHFLTDASSQYLRDIISETQKRRVCLIGLHACADLSVTILKLFTELDEAKSLVIMPCCYHRLQQCGEGFKNFPASKTLLELFQAMEMNHYLKVPFLRLACQGCIDQFTSKTKKEREDEAYGGLFRAILQDVAESENRQVRRLKRKSGKLKQSSDPFETYLANLKHTHALVEGDITDHQFLRKMHEKWTEHKGKAPLIEALAALQAAIQSVCENVILLDRVVFLKEKGVECFVMKVTDQGISPRCHALVAIKA